METLSNIYYWIYRLFKWSLPKFWKDLKRGIKNLIYWFPVIYKDWDWDYSYLYELEYHKLKSMCNSFEKYAISDGTKEIKQMKICIALLEIILDKDELFEFRCINVHVNLANKDRFLPNIDHTALSYYNIPALVREEKALCLYNRIKIQYSKTWWD